MVSVYYGEEFLTISKHNFNKVKTTELIFLITDISRSKTALKITDNNHTEVITFRKNKILSFFTAFNGTQRQEILTQIDLNKLGHKLKNLNITPLSQSVKIAQKKPQTKLSIT